MEVPALGATNMFEREIQLNKFLLEYYQRVVADIPADRIGERAPGHGHPPVWVLGHLAINTEFGCQFFGIPVEHPAWMIDFGPASTDEVNAAEYSKDDFVKMTLEGYPRLCDAILSGTPEQLDAPHGIRMLAGTPIVTVGELMSHLLTSHFAFHLAQLSGWRRAAGKGPLF